MKNFKEKTVEELQVELAGLNAEAAEIQEELNERKRDTFVECTYCKVAYRVRDLTYIQTHWYESPYGCAGGDNWHRGEGQFGCPGCKVRNRLHNRPDVDKLKPFFGKYVEEHKD